MPQRKVFMNDTQTQAAAAPHFSTADFQTQLDKAGDKPVMVDFYAEWCGPCKIAAPIIDKLSVEYKGKAVIAKLDTEEDHDIAQKYGIMSIPTVLIFKKGQEVARKIGFPGEPVYRQMIEAAIGDSAAAA